MIRTSLLFAGSVLLACAGVVEDALIAEPSDVAPVVATLELRDQRLTIASSANGVRYDVADAGGTRSHLTLEQLEAFAPELAELVRSASAAHGLDARLDASAGMVWAGRAPR